jgi:hypothetical protein
MSEPSAFPSKRLQGLPIATVAASLANVLKWRKAAVREG